MTRGEGSVIIIEGIGYQSQVSDFTFVFRYLASLFPSHMEGGFEVNLQGKRGLMNEGFEYYA